MPIWVVPCAFLLKERITALKLAGVVAGICGIAALFNPVALDWHDGGKVFGSLLPPWGGIVLVAGHSAHPTAPMAVESLYAGALADAGRPARRWSSRRCASKAPPHPLWSPTLTWS